MKNKTQYRKIFERAGAHFLFGAGIVLLIVCMCNKHHIGFGSGLFSLMSGSLLLAAEEI